MILVTGGTGLVGANLLYFLSKKKYKIRAIKRTHSKTQDVLAVFMRYDAQHAKEYFDSIEWVESDLATIPNLLEALEGIDEVYHAAGYVGFKMSDYTKLREINKQGTFNLVNACIKKQVKSICFLSSVAVLSEKDEQGFIHEAFGTNEENSYYGYTKTAAEMEIWRAAEEGMSVVVVNPSIILGTGVSSNSSNILFTQQKKMLFYPKGGSGFVDVRDVANCCIELMEKKVFNQRFVLNSENKSYKEIFSLFRNELGLSNPNKLPDWILPLYIGFVKIKSFFMWQGIKMNTLVLENLNHQTNYSNKKIINTLGVKFISVQESIKFHTENTKKNITL
jgi:dihydroflavonol-4-reductase